MARPSPRSEEHPRTVVVFDQRGTGASRAAMGDASALTVAGAVADLDALRAALGLQHLGLIGHSWGAMLSLACAAAYASESIAPHECPISPRCCRPSAARSASRSATAPATVRALASPIAARDAPVPR